MRSADEGAAGSLSEGDLVCVDVGEVLFCDGLHLADYFGVACAEVCGFGGIIGEVEQCRSCAWLREFGVVAVEKEFPVVEADCVEAFGAVPVEQVPARMRPG